MMQKIVVGQLRISTSSHVYAFPTPEESNTAASRTPNPRPDLKAEIRVINDSFWVRLCAMSDLGFAEAYMYGDVECDDLISLFEVRLWSQRKMWSNFLQMVRCSWRTEKTSQIWTPAFPTFSPSHKKSRRTASSVPLETHGRTFPHIMTFRMTCLPVRFFPFIVVDQRNWWRFFQLWQASSQRTWHIRAPYFRS